MVLFFKPNKYPDSLNSGLGGDPFSIAIVDVEDIDEALNVLFGVSEEVILWDGCFVYLNCDLKIL